MALGFVGTGTITAAMVEGLNLETDFGEILVSPRNAEVAASLAARFPNVRIADNNQQVLDFSETVVLAIRPQVADEVLSSLKFKDRHQVVSLIATVSLEYLRNAAAPATSVTRAVPLPSVARKRGPTAVFPPDPETIALFDQLGTAFELEEESEFDVFTAATAVMSSYFAFAHTVSHWMKEHGVSADKAHGYTAQMLNGLSCAVTANGHSNFVDLAQDHQTAGGINEQVFNDVTENGIIPDLHRSLDGVLARLRRNRRQ